MRTISIGSRRPFSISSTPTAGAGWRKYLPLTSASARMTDSHRNWAAALRGRYRRQLRRDRASCVLLRARAGAAVHNSRLIRSTHHTHSYWSPVTRFHLALALNRDNGARRPQTGPQAPPQTMRSSAPRPILCRNVLPHVPMQGRRMRVEVLRYVWSVQRRRKELTRSVQRTDHFHCHRIERIELDQFAREIAVRVRRVEQLPPRRATQAFSKTSPAASSAGHHSGTQTRHLDPPYAKPAPVRQPEHPPTLDFTIETLAESVMRQIDRRIIAQRERRGRL